MEMYKYCIIPAYFRKLDRLIDGLVRQSEPTVVESQPTQDDGHILDQSRQQTIDKTSVEYQQFKQQLERGLFTFDGALPHLAAVMTDLSQRCLALKLELFKYAAKCSMVQQANDTSHSYGTLKRAVSNLKFKGDVDTSCNVSRGMKRFIGSIKVRYGLVCINSCV